MYYKSGENVVYSSNESYILQSDYDKSTAIEKIEEFTYDRDELGNIIFDNVSSTGVDDNGKKIKFYNLEPRITSVKINESSYNPNDGLSVVIPDDSIILTKEEYLKEIEKLKNI